jgi:serine/threonine-protein kinase
VTTEQYSADVDAGIVYEQVPVAGTSLVKGATVLIVVSKGAVPPKVEVPNVVGKSGSDAQSAIEKVGLTYAAYEVFDNKTAAGNVIGQLPTGGTQVSPGSEVKVAVSKGPGVGQVSVPGVVGQQESAAVSAIESVDLKASVYRQFSDTVAVGIVIGQVPAAGTTTGSGSEVGILVSLGPDTGSTTVPSLTSGMNLEQATAALTAVGLVPVVAQDFSDTVAVGNVIGQLPAAGSTVPPGSQVVVLISKGPAPAATP